MRQRNQVELPPGVTDPKLTTDNLVQSWGSKKLFENQAAHRDDQVGF